MKLLIAFALFAVAFADEIRVVPLPLSPLFSMPSMGQVIIPNYIIDAVRVGMPVMRDEALVVDDEGLKVHVVDAPLDVAAPEFSPYESVLVVAIPEPVRLGEAPLPAFETAPDAVRVVDVAPDAEEIAVESVRIAEPSLPVVASIVEEIVPEPVQIAEANLLALEAADVHYVNIVDGPLEVAHIPEEIAVESVKIAEPSLPVFASVAEEIVPEPVQIAEAPLPAIDAVRFVDTPLDVAAPEPVRLAEPAVPAFETAPAVEAVKIAIPQYRDYRVKQFEDPRLR